ncbi:hypothetical protein SAMN04488498_11561 [Mesorhizobium albiziae]|uniref:Uncharacterized protein n=1 Tax=Neomesorhizobium albiziae TaxID=335020 RepID=A0A1I4D1P8_9HYPH|nr:hypothetical protein SAMN04488498_11561 [Mesorhizobium albiziae]
MVQTIDFITFPVGLNQKSSSIVSYGSATAERLKLARPMPSGTAHSFDVVIERYFGAVSRQRSCLNIDVRIPLGHIFPNGIAGALETQFRFGRRRSNLAICHSARSGRHRPPRLPRRTPPLASHDSPVLEDPFADRLNRVGDPPSVAVPTCPGSGLSLGYDGALTQDDVERRPCPCSRDGDIRLITHRQPPCVLTRPANPKLTN